MTAYQSPNMALPWYSSFEDDARFNKILRAGLIILLVLAVAVPLIPVPELTRQEREALPPQLAQVLMEKKELPKPPPPLPQAVEPEVTETVKQEAEPEALPEEVKPPEPKPADAVEQARKKAASTGLMLLQDDLAAMREAVDTRKLNDQTLSRGEQQAARVERSAITSGVAATSGGINTAALSTDTGVIALAARETTQVESELASRSEAAEAAAATPAGARRSDEEIRQIMDSNKDAIFAIYNRALRSNPALQGKVTIKLTISPEGRITAADIVSSELADAALESRLLARIRLIAFEARGVIETVVNYTFDFLPN